MRNCESSEQLRTEQNCRYRNKTGDTGMKERLDVLVVSRGLAPSREKAKAIIMAGNVLVDGQREDKAGSMFKDTVEITVKGHT